MIKSLRFRITAWYVGFFTLLFAGFGLFLYHELARDLMDRLDSNLASLAKTGASLYADELTETPGDRVKAAADVLSNLRLGASHVAILSGERVLAWSAPIPETSLAAIRSRTGAADLVMTLARARAAVHRDAAQGQPVLVVAWEPLDAIAAQLALVSRVLWFAMPLLLALAAGGGYVLASRNLAPVGWMAEQAHRISGSNLETRLEIGDAAEELVVLSASFNELLGRLDQSFESMRRFVADASHELRTPLSVIRGEADVSLTRDRSPAEYRESLAIILDESRRLSRLVDDLLNLARADAGHVKLRLEEFYFNDLVADCCRSLQALAAARHIALECHASGDVRFRGDEDLLRRLIVNLLDNAIRYTPPGGQVSADLEAQGDTVRVRVSDTGVGIGPDAAPHVFERFYRVDKARSRAEGGFGLGLSIVKWIAESHHGAVELSSRPEAGSVFTVTLPR